MATQEPGTTLDIAIGSIVSCRDGRVGRLDHVLLDPQTGIIQALVVRRGALLGRDVIVPAGKVTWIEEGEIRIDADRAALEEFPAYRPARSDEQITAEVQERLAAQELTRDEPGIAAHGHGGVLRLSGVVHTEEVRQAAAEVAGAVPGVREVQNGLLIGPNVAQAVIEALVHDPRTAGAVIDAGFSAGGLTLRGQVRTVQEKEAAVSVARSVADVVAVIDELEIQPDAARGHGPSSVESQLAALGRIGPPR